jgi:hypothetical protein
MLISCRKAVYSAYCRYAGLKVYADPINIQYHHHFQIKELFIQLLGCPGFGIGFGIVYLIQSVRKIIKT